MSVKPWLYNNRGATMPEIARARAWAEQMLGAASSSLVITREGDRNRVVLRFLLEGASAECEAVALISLRRARLSQSRLADALKEILCCEV